MPVSEQGALTPTFTNGPWHIEPVSSDSFHKQISAFDDTGNRAMCVRLQSFTPDADAHAIAALPDLYEAAIPMVDIINDVENDGAVKDTDCVTIEVVHLRHLRAALAKARGEV